MHWNSFFIQFFISYKMDTFSIVLIAVGLAMDSFAVATCKGICTRKFHFFYTLRIALLFGLFQGIMPLIGFYAGNYFSEQIKMFGHWIAFALLGFIGIKMIIDSLKTPENDCETDNSVKKHFKWKTLFVLALATSIDALVIGVVFVPFPCTIWKAVAIIAVISFLFAFAGVFIGIYFGKRFRFKVEILGGVILIAIGLKILAEHFFF